MNSRRSESSSTPQVSNTRYLLKLRNINTHRFWRWWKYEHTSTLTHQLLPLVSNLLIVRDLQHLRCQGHQRDVFLPLPRLDKVVNVTMFCHLCSLLFEFHLLLLLESLHPSHLLCGVCCLQESFLSDTLQIQLIPPFFYNIPLLVRERLGYVLDYIVESNKWHVPETRRAHEVPDSWFILFFRYSWPITVRCRSPLIVQDHHIRSIPSPVCPFCPTVTVPSQTLILLSFGKENKKSIKKKSVTATLNNCPYAKEIFWRTYIVYYESIKREPKIRGIYECRCDERLQTKSKEFTRLAYTGLVLERNCHDDDFFFIFPSALCKLRI